MRMKKDIGFVLLNYMDFDNRFLYGFVLGYVIGCVCYFGLFIFGIKKEKKRIKKKENVYFYVFRFIFFIIILRK